MKWSPATIRQFASEAGFTGRPLAGAVALALATSGGHDGYDVTAGVPGAGHWSGLWGVDTDRWPYWSPVDLHHPPTAAHAAFALTAALRSFAWSPVWCSGHWWHYYDQAVTAAQATPYSEDVRVPVNLDLHRRLRTGMAGTGKASNG